MTGGNDNTSREQRLAEKLRENLRRRKAQTREIGREIAQELDEPDRAALPKSGEDG